MIRLASVKPELRWEARLLALGGSPSLANGAQPLPRAKTSQRGRSFLPRCVDEWVVYRRSNATATSFTLVPVGPVMMRPPTFSRAW